MLCPYNGKKEPAGSRRYGIPRLPMVARDRHASSHVWLTKYPLPPTFFRKCGF
jgi:hypothetical protein